ncbi:DUF6155 family protein [Youngiibacter fragilis]|uniref:Uncharacterized protein n=1 Tax=Youngiibacter fragilis 232.1 TaxID=994573 RepID=V7I8A3_9CLOT|nr:DUF6155 family protein [Youngiibacter fragilis]ETA81227.1 hypothetical protein T472_0207860 [Youngiibacter fragilis 232.1]
MAKQMTLTELKNKLKGMENAELIELISGLYKANGMVKEILNSRFAGEGYQAEMLEAYKNKLEKEFFPKNMRKMPSLKTAKSYVTDFKKIGTDEMVMDLTLYYVECGTEFTNTFGDMDAQFYQNMVSMFEEFAHQINVNGTKENYETLKKRIRKLVHDASGIGWGYSEEIYQVYADIYKYDDEEED